MRKLAVGVWVLAMFVCAACGAPGDLAKQAEEVGSISAEGALLAHGAAADSTLATFTRVHARALRGKAAELDGVVEDERLARLLDRTKALLTGLADDPDDREAARRTENRLENVAERARALTQ